MAGGVAPWVVPVLLALCAVRGGTLEVVDVDLAGPGCSSAGERVLSSSQSYRLHADVTPGAHPTYRGCNVTVRTADAGAILRYTVRRFAGPAHCGVVLRVYEDPQSVNEPSLVQTCTVTAMQPVQGSSAHGKLTFSLRRNMTQISTFQLEILVTTALGYVEVQDKAYAAMLTDDGNNSGGSGDPTPTPAEGEGGGSLNIGVVIGIAIAGIILIIALVGLAIYCCLQNRNADFKDMEAADQRSGTSVFTSGTSQVLFAGANNDRKGGGKYGSMEDVRSSSTDRANNLYSNKGYQVDDDEHRSDRDAASHRDRGGHKNTAFVDESDHAAERGGHMSRRDSGRGGKYDKKKNFSRNEEYEMSKVSKVPNGILKTRSRSPNRSQSSTEGSTVDSNALVYGYSQTTHAHPNTQHIPVLERTRSRSRSRGASSHRSGSAGRSRSGSIGKSAGKDSKGPKTSRQYSDMSHFLEKPRDRPRSRSGSMGRRSRSDSKTSDNSPSEVSFAPSGNSSKKNTGGRRVHIQSVETDF